MGELLRSAYAKRLVDQHQVILRSKVLRMHQWSISLLGACEGLFATGAAPLNLWRPTARSSRSLRPIWISSTCLAMLSGHASATVPAHALPGGLSLDRVAAPSRLRHFPPHRCHLRHQLGGPSRATRAWYYPERAGAGASARHAPWGVPLQPLSRPRASATNGSSMTGRCSSVLFSVIPSSVLWTLLLPPLVPPGGAPHTATSRAPRSSFVRLSASPSFRDGTRRTCTTPLTS